MRMRDYIIRRLLLVIPVIIGILLISFLLSHLVGDPAAAYTTERTSPWQIERIREQYHLNEPLWVQFWFYLDGLIHGDLGWSRAANMPTTQAIATFFPATMELSVVAIIVALVMGIPLGIKSAINKDQPVDHVLRVVSLGGVSMPIFWFAMMLQYFLYYQLGAWGLPHLPSGFRGGDGTITFMSTHSITGFYLIDSLLNLRFDLFLDSLVHLFLPAFCLAYLMLAQLSRMMRSSMLEVMRQDYIILARSKGLSEKVVIYKHAMKNALIPTVTVGGLLFGGLLVGAVLTETIFNWPGIGRWSVLAMTYLDLGGIMGFVLLSGFVFVIANLVVDVLYAFLDPRVRFG